MVEDNAIPDSNGSGITHPWQNREGGNLSTLPVITTPQKITLAASSESPTTPRLKRLH